MSLVKLTHIEDVIEELARSVLGSDRLNEAITIIRGFREALGHEEPEAYVVDSTPAAAKDEAISQLSSAVQELLAEVAALKAGGATAAPAAPAAGESANPPAPVEPAAPVDPAALASAPPLAAAPVTPVNPFEVAAAAPAVEAPSDPPASS